MEGGQGRESSGRENSESSQSFDRNLFKIIDVPPDGSCLFWAATLAYLVPVKYDEYAFHERFSRLFGFKETQELTEIQKSIQEHSSTDYVHIDKNERLKAFVTKEFRERVIDEMSSNQNGIIQSITLDDILSSKNAEYITNGTFKTEFTDIFGSSTSVEIEKLKPSSLNKNTIRIINEELEKIKDQEKCELFKFRSYLQCMRECTAWGGNHEITAICQVLRCNVQVFSRDTTYSFDYPNSSDQIYLFYTNQVHYKFGLIHARDLIRAMRNPDMTQKAKSYVSLGIHDINYQDTVGWTALHFAAQSGRMEIIRALLAQGASTKKINNRNKNPIQTAMFCATEVNGLNSHMEIAVILLDEKQPEDNLREDEKKRLFDYIKQYHPKISKELQSPESRRPNYSASDKADSSQPGLSADQPKSQREQESQSSENGLVSEKNGTGSPVTETMESHVSSSTGSTTEQILNGNSQQMPKDLIDDAQATIAQEAGSRDTPVEPAKNNVNRKELCNRAIIFFKIDKSSKKDISRIVVKCKALTGDWTVNTESDENEVSSPHIHVVIEELLQYLKCFQKDCTLAAWSCNDDDGPLLAGQIEKAKLTEEFSRITKFVDIKQVYREKFPKKGSHFKFNAIAKSVFHITDGKLADARDHVSWLEELVKENLDLKDIHEMSSSFDSYT